MGSGEACRAGLWRPGAEGLSTDRRRPIQPSQCGYQRVASSAAWPRSMQFIVLLFSLRGLPKPLHLVRNPASWRRRHGA